MKAIRRFILFVASLVAIIVVALREASICDDRKELNKLKDEKEKLIEFNRIWNQWLDSKLSGKKISDYFRSHGYEKVAIYGIKELGIALFKELEQQGIDVRYGIDKNKSVSVEGLTVVSPEDKLEDVDVVVVTAIHYFGEIAEELGSKMTCPIISIENLFVDID
ncbi:hypothetical protein [Butyrivibrio proteoclasticus]|uniref:hypothetical protein n=1 Tax=Butyrivibrio proteoclasticus TaxID=43305 RepID=UPI00054CE636|nr:hypothetical protein [Butyrivibrio proteoclasticus]